jgi:hypothetical protein
MALDIEEFAQKLKFQVIEAKPIDRLKIIQDALTEIPDPPRRAVEHFVAATLIYSDGKISQLDTDSQKIRAIQKIATMAFTFSIVSIIAGVVIGFYSTEPTENSFSIFGADFRTTNTSVAFISVGALIALFTFKPAIKNLGKSL